MRGTVRLGCAVKSPIQAICGDAECVNNANAKMTLVCSACGRCADHSHQDCEETETERGRDDGFVRGAQWPERRQ